MDRQGDVLAIHRGDGNRDDFLRYPKKMDVEDEYKTEAFRDGDEAVRDEVEHEQQNNLGRNENGQGGQVVVVERDGLQTKDGENDEQITSYKNDCSSPKVDALEDLKASSEEEVGVCSSESVNREDEDEDEPLERVNRDEEEQTVLERDEKVLGFVSMDNKESASDSSPERDDMKDGPNTLSREITKELDTKVSNGHFDVVGTEEDTGTSNRCENGDGNRVLGKDGEDKTQVDNSVIRKMEMIEVTGEQDSPDAVKSAGETSQNVYFNGPVLPQSPSQGHRRAQSEIGTPGHRRTNSFQKLKTQMQKAWRGVSNLRDDNRPTFNPEVLANQKRQWYQLHSKALLVFLSLFLGSSIKTF